eukprot:CAMPEP_0178519190 /NCGR_PEP_ID=MMETSP0696-20121128/26690_1 /TAXON_ID=265572 /ORGANISM="Extubocellulus spinifer, Strain CCMP396" /LENGTH=566 /DNA_ID=CAMNT_0020149867 /DNA_START=132 /DNA_END=1832 /DNA_ORIENTATION=-
MPKSILKKSENLYISEAERELRGSSNGALSYRDISYGYEDGHLVEIHQPVDSAEAKEIGSSRLSASDHGRRCTDRGDGVDCIDGGGVSAGRGQGFRRERRGESGQGEGEDDLFKFDASFRALDKDEEVIEDTKTSNSVCNQRQSGDLVRRVEVTGRQRRSNPDHQYGSNEDGEGYHSDEYEKNQRSRYKKEEKEVPNQRKRETQSAYTVRNSNMAAKRRAAERRSRVGMIRDATAHSGKRSGTSNLTLPAPELRRARSDDAAQGRGISKGSELGSSSRYQSSKQKVSERGSYGQRHGTDSSHGDAQVNEQAKRSVTSALVSANAKRGVVFEKYRRKSDLLTAERGDDSSRSAPNGSQSAAHDSFRSERSSASTNQSAASRSKHSRTSAGSAGSTGEAGRHHRRTSSSGREEEWTGRTQRRSSSRSRPLNVASPYATSGSANESFDFNNSSRMAVSSLSARIRQRGILGAGTDSGRSIPAVAQESSRQRSLNNGAPSVEGELSGDSRGGIGFDASTGDVSAQSFFSERSGGSSMTGGGHSLGSRSSRSEKRAYSSKESRMHIKDASH